MEKTVGVLSSDELYASFYVYEAVLYVSQRGVMHVYFYLQEERGSEIRSRGVNGDTCGGTV